MRPRSGIGERWRSTVIVGASAAASLFFLPTHPVFSQPIDPPADNIQSGSGWRETWAGVDATRDQWLDRDAALQAKWRASSMTREEFIRHNEELIDRTIDGHGEAGR